ncbi:hypothetical protein M9H77_24311 [Catharanthus roseus]|uniref:Uncharacterized protein n=1 Tax=Catharanthus roseus TaxID=4058 RepID=A0ACC0AZU5_CATRO|nr:hypothetical protein M9H77_24311 [Catharanthus roseus]
MVHEFGTQEGPSKPICMLNSSFLTNFFPFPAQFSLIVPVMLWASAETDRLLVLCLGYPLGRSSCCLLFGLPLDRVLLAVASGPPLDRVFREIPAAWAGHPGRFLLCLLSPLLSVGQEQHRTTSFRDGVTEDHKGHQRRATDAVSRSKEGEKKKRRRQLSGRPRRSRKREKKEESGVTLEPRRERDINRSRVTTHFKVDEMLKINYSHEFVFIILELLKFETSSNFSSLSEIDCLICCPFHVSSRIRILLSICMLKLPDPLLLVLYHRGRQALWFKNNEENAIQPGELLKFTMKEFEAMVGNMSACEECVRTCQLLHWSKKDIVPKVTRFFKVLIGTDYKEALDVLLHLLHFFLVIFCFPIVEWRNVGPNRYFSTIGDTFCIGVIIPGLG